MFLLRILCGMNLLGLMSSMTTPLPQRVVPVPVTTMTIPRMTPDQYRQERLKNGAESMDRPILIEQVLSAQQCEHICDELVTHAGLTPIQLQRKTSSKTTIYDVTLQNALSLMMDSTPTDAIFCFVEGLLDTHDALQSSKRLLQQARESLFPNNNDNNDDQEEEPSSPSSVNWFDYFPDFALPSDCVVIAGHGATSTLHRDPFEWTGTSLCLEGRKLWRFLPPTPLPPDDRLESYRLPSIAWNNLDEDDTDPNDKNGDSQFVLSAGWQSDFALFTNNPNDSDKDINVVNPRDLAEKSESEADAIVQQMGACSISLPPHLPPGLTTNKNTTTHKNKDTNNKHVPYLSVMQTQGDLLLIPAHWYHQTYAPEPSLAVASQRCGSWEARRVLDHILALQQQDDKEKEKRDIPMELHSRPGYEDQDAKSTVELLFHYLQGMAANA
jgi:hypothetical protein